MTFEIVCCGQANVNTFNIDRHEKKKKLVKDRKKGQPRLLRKRQRK